MKKIFLNTIIIICLIGVLFGLLLDCDALIFGLSSLGMVLSIYADIKQ